MDIAGKWRITEMDTWSRDAIDLVGTAYIEFRGLGGRFLFVAVEGWMDCRHKMKSGRPYVEFAWDGNDECDPASGRGWARLLKDGSLTGYVSIQRGDSSAFKAVPFHEKAEGRQRE